MAFNNTKDGQKVWVPYNSSFLYNYAPTNDAVVARFFWERVTGHHSFVIGGNGDREYFFEPYDLPARH